MHPKTKTLICFLFFILVLINGCGTDSDEGNTQKKVIVFAAAGTIDATTEIANAFTEETDIEVTLNFASASVLAQQIDVGADADVFISANKKWADYVQEKQLVARRQVIVKNRIVIIVPANSPLSNDSPEILLSDDIKCIATGEISSVPVGRYGKDALENLGLWEKVKDKIIPTRDVRSALAYVESQAAEAGIVYYTDAIISDKVKIAYTFPEEVLSKPIEFSSMTLNNAVNKENANLFYDYLIKDKAVSIFKKYGYQTN